MLRLRAWAAIAWLAFCVLVVAAVVSAPWVIMAMTPNPPSWTDPATVSKILLLPAGLGLLWVLFQAWSRVQPLDDPRDVVVSEDEHPKLWSIVQSVAERVSAPMPENVILTSDARINLRFRPHSEIAIGARALHLLTEDHLRALLAHELAYLNPGRRSGRVWAWRVQRACQRLRQEWGQMAHWVLTPLVIVARPLALPSHRALEDHADACAAECTSPSTAAQALRCYAVAQLAWDQVDAHLLGIFDYAGKRAPLGEAVEWAAAEVQHAQAGSSDQLSRVDQWSQQAGTEPWGTMRPASERLDRWLNADHSADSLSTREPRTAPASSLLGCSLDTVEVGQLRTPWPLGTWDDVVRRGCLGQMAVLALGEVRTLLADRVIRVDTVREVLTVVGDHQAGRLVDEWFDLGNDPAQEQGIESYFADERNTSLADAVHVVSVIIGTAALLTGASVRWGPGIRIDLPHHDRQMPERTAQPPQDVWAWSEHVVYHPNDVPALLAALDQGGVDVDAPLLGHLDAAARAIVPQLEGVMTGMAGPWESPRDVYVWSHAIVTLPSDEEHQQYVRAFVQQRHTPSLDSGQVDPQQVAEQAVQWEHMVAHPQATVLLYDDVEDASMGWVRQRCSLRLRDGSTVALKPTSESTDFGEPTTALYSLLAERGSTR